MANKKGEVVQEQIKNLYEQGWSIRRIAKRLQIHRATVTRYISKCTTPPAGNPVSDGGDCIAKKQRSLSAEYESIIKEKLTKGLSAQRIYQDLQDECDFKHSYDSVKRLVRKLRKTCDLPFRRMECDPGEEAQIDYGEGYWIQASSGHRRKIYVLRVTLSYSRKSYSEVMFRQNTENFMRGIENALRSFGGSPRVLVVDNLKAGVIKADLYDPELNPKLRDFAHHYNLEILPCRPRTPRHKGKIESAVKYVQNNALKGRTFESLDEANEHLKSWEKNVADMRIHGTTRKQVIEMFMEEKKSLQQLPGMLFESFEEFLRIVHNDGHVEVHRAYYSVPMQYVRHKVWVRYTFRTLRIYDLKMRQIAIHCTMKEGQRSTCYEHIPQEKISNPERGNEWLLKHLSFVGTNALAWSKSMLSKKGIAGTRVLNGLLVLTKQYSYHDVDQACKIALGVDHFDLRTIKNLLKESPKGEQQKLPFMDEHALIRPVDKYESLLNTKEIFDEKLSD